MSGSYYILWGMPDSCTQKSATDLQAHTPGIFQLLTAALQQSWKLYRFIVITGSVWLALSRGIFYQLLSSEKWGFLDSFFSFKPVVLTQKKKKIHKITVGICAAQVFTVHVFISFCVDKFYGASTQCTKCLELIFLVTRSAVFLSTILHAWQIIAIQTCIFGCRSKGQCFITGFWWP